MCGGKPIFPPRALMVVSHPPFTSLFHYIRILGSYNLGLQAIKLSTVSLWSNSSCLSAFNTYWVQRLLTADGVIFRLWRSRIKYLHCILDFQILSRIYGYCNDLEVWPKSMRSLGKNPQNKTQLILMLPQSRCLNPGVSFVVQCFSAASRCIF